MRHILALGTLFAALSAAPAAAPNIIFILADDLGWTDLGCQGSAYYETPRIDRMAAEGLRFTAGYTGGPNCQPTRSCLMSGQYNPRTGVYTVGGTGRFDTSMRPLVPVPNIVDLALEKVTVAEALKAAGYATGMFGKWHLGDPEQFGPAKQGFDEAIVSMGKHFKFNTYPKMEVAPDVYLADFLTDHVVKFIESHKGGPFFLYLPHFGVHSPHDSKPDKEAHFKDKPAAGGHNSPAYAGMIASVDESVGRVLDKLDALGIAENTLVIFSSDNGGVGGYEEIFKDAPEGGGGKGRGKGKRGKGGGDADEGGGHGITANVPLRGGKGMLYEGGIRVPYIFRWKGVIPPGGTCGQPIHSVDLYPTLVDLAGAAPPKDYPLDGVSYAACLKSGGSAKISREALFWHFPGYLGSGKNIWRTTPVGVIRRGDHKLIEFFEDRHLELYNLADDLGETTNLAKDRPDLAKELHDQLVAWRERLHAPMPRPRGGDQAP
ncbi:MAG: sulfatase [Verrucomicrobiae bacterium]|nr:sulfatase [Verrucomicrobiae bacterium]